MKWGWGEISWAIEDFIAENVVKLSPKQHMCIMNPISTPMSSLYWGVSNPRNRVFVNILKNMHFTAQIPLTKIIPHKISHQMAHLHFNAPSTVSS